MKEIKFDSKDFIENHGLQISYVRVYCPKCTNSWGVTVRNGMIEKRSLICEKCAATEAAEKIVSD